MLSWSRSTSALQLFDLSTALLAVQRPAEEEGDGDQREQLGLSDTDRTRRTRTHPELVLLSLAPLIFSGTST